MSLRQAIKDGYRIRCSICGCDKYTKRGNSGTQWLFECSNGHRWLEGSLFEEFPWREDDYYNPKYWAWDTWGKYRRLDDPEARFPTKSMTKEQLMWRMAKEMRK